jgi:hypothetical protein
MDFFPHFVDASAPAAVLVYLLSFNTSKCYFVHPQQQRWKNGNNKIIPAESE